MYVQWLTKKLRHCWYFTSTIRIIQCTKKENNINVKKERICHKNKYFQIGITGSLERNVFSIPILNIVNGSIFNIKSNEDFEIIIGDPKNKESIIQKCSAVLGIISKSGYVREITDNAFGNGSNCFFISN